MTLRTGIAMLRPAAEMARLGDRLLDKLWLLMVAAVGERWWPAGRSVRLRLRALGRAFSCTIDDYTQLLALREVFLDEDYRIDGCIAPETILDLGSNIGASLIYFRLRYPQARLIGFEPDPRVFARLERNVAQFDAVEVFNAAVAPTGGQLTFFRYPEYSWASSLMPLWGSAADQITVAARTLDDVVDDLGLGSVDLLKIDIEGAEWDVLPGFRQIHKVRTLIGEVHRIGEAAPKDLLNCLSDFQLSVLLASDTIVRFVATRD
jgi:FkbM family methyltransferase